MKKLNILCLRLDIKTDQWFADIMIDDGDNINSYLKPISHRRALWINGKTTFANTCDVCIWRLRRSLGVQINAN